MNQTFRRILIACLVAFILPAFYGCNYKNDNIPTNPDIPDDTPEIPVWEVSIEKVHDVLQGHFQDVDLTIKLDSLEFGGFDLLIGYDAAILAFTEAELGGWLHDCGWEYFTYRYNWNGNCGDDCPSGLIRLVGIAETNNGNHHPDYGCITDIGQGILATLTFFVSGDRQYECMRLPIQFYWQDCSDNTMTVVSRDSLFLNRNIYDCYDSSIQDYASVFPTYDGAPDDTCMQGDKYKLVRYVDFHNGYVDIVCSDSIDSPRGGDINCNGLAFEVADAVMFANYFIRGTDAWSDWAIECFTDASDVNGDGKTLTLADFVYLVRVIVGEAVPNPPPPQAVADVYYQNGTVGIASTANLGAALFVFQTDGSSNAPVLLVDDMDIMYGETGNELRVLIYNIGSEYIPAGPHLVLSVDSNALLISAELATYDGGMVETKIRIQ